MNAQLRRALRAVINKISSETDTLANVSQKITEGGDAKALYDFDVPEVIECLEEMMSCLLGHVDDQNTRLEGMTDNLRDGSVGQAIEKRSEQLEDGAGYLDSAIESLTNYGELTNLAETLTEIIEGDLDDAISVIEEAIAP